MISIVKCIPYSVRKNKDFPDNIQVHTDTGTHGYRHMREVGREKEKGEEREGEKATQKKQSYEVEQPKSREGKVAHPWKGQ